MPNKNLLLKLRFINHWITTTLSNFNMFLKIMKMCTFCSKFVQITLWMNLSKEEKDWLKWKFNITWFKLLVLLNTFMLIKSFTEISSWVISSSMKTWKSNLVTLVLPPDWSTIKKKRKQFAVLQIILRLKFFKEKVTLMKLIFGQSELLFIHNWLENLHLKLQKLKPHTKKLRLAVTVSRIMSQFLKRPENWSKES